jgi:Zn ribbon nucleic-acid-binding protein
MERTVECLKCGATRQIVPVAWGRLDTGECPRCGYVGWAPSRDLTELVRRALREHPPARRRLYAL